MNEQEKAVGKGLDGKQRAIVSIAACTAIGNLKKLEYAINRGMDAGLTVNECKEVMVQLYAYCGFPRSLNALGVLMQVLDVRKAKGIVDIPGPEASPVAGAAGRYERGKNILEVLTKRPENGPKTGLAAFCPVIDSFLKEHLFADIFERDVLSYADRELVTVAALTSLKGVEPQLQAHLAMAKNVGLSQPELDEISQYLEELD
jgi:alkylhydroperoxidase/carboxymuconolactone decarboxylase family protein YurZ